MAAGNGSPSSSPVGPQIGPSLFHNTEDPALERLPSPADARSGTLAFSILLSLEHLPYPLLEQES